MTSSLEIAMMVLSSNEDQDENQRLAHSDKRIPSSFCRMVVYFFSGNFDSSDTVSFTITTFSHGIAFVFALRYLWTTRKQAKDDTTPDQLVSINYASDEDLESLPGVGNVKAQRIMQNRPYKYYEDLQRVFGISKEMVESWVDEGLIKP